MFFHYVSQEQTLQLRSREVPAFLAKSNPASDPSGHQAISGAFFSLTSWCFPLLLVPMGHTVGCVTRISAISPAVRSAELSCRDLLVQSCSKHSLQAQTHIYMQGFPGSGSLLFPLFGQGPVPSGFSEVCIALSC